MSTYVDNNKFLHVGLCAQFSQ